MFGEIVEGTGKGKKFLKIRGYQKRFVEKLNFKPYAGTLNLKVNKDRLEEFLRDKKAILIEGFKKGNKEYGDVKCYKVRIAGIPGAIVFPEKTIYKKEIIEIISYVNLREMLKLRTGDKIQLR